MKKMSGMILVAVFTLFLAGQSFAQSETTVDKQDPQKKATKTESPCKFADKNSNGVCDKFEAGGKDGKGEKFKDANGDGICDNHGEAINAKGKKDCTGHSTGKCAGHANQTGCKGPCGSKHDPGKK
ncbi:MAG: hypothetical protein RQ761_12695 [Bacteroidales bacterium]|nr:hypothetical protein [Bacteroidales bacterium]